MTALSYLTALMTSTADAGLHRAGEAQELASMALLSVVLAGLSVIVRDLPPRALDESRPDQRPRR